jgi:hypothetical protein
MLGTKSSRDADDPCRKLDNIAAATAEMMWAVALATTRVAVASAAQNLAIWSRMLRAPADPWLLRTRTLESHENVPADAAAAAPQSQAPESADAAPGESQAFASYRSSGGHASAQVTKPH